MRLLACVIVLLVASGCGSSTNQVSPSTAADHLKAAIPNVSKVVALTEANDPNNLIGRPNGYLAAVVLYDSRVSHCGGSGFGSSCGAMIEQWPSEAKAKDRMTFIQSMESASPILGSEYDYVHGDLLLRVTGSLKPSQAAAYRTTFLG